MNKFKMDDVVLDTTSVYPQDVPCRIVGLWATKCMLRPIEPLEGMTFSYEINLSSIVPYKGM
jgi:hypothetical protein